jgi:hypothetical protein
MNLFLQLRKVGIGTAQINSVNIFKDVYVLKECSDSSMPPGRDWTSPDPLPERWAQVHVLIYLITYRMTQSDWCKLSWN